MEIRFHNCGPTVSSREIEEFEVACGWKLPQGYHAFLIKHNGGVPSRRDIRFAGHPDGTDSVDLFCGVGHPEPVFDSYFYVREFPLYIKVGLIPIAATACSSFLCVDMKQPGTPIVYVDVADEAQTAEGKTRYFVARDVEELCRMLR